MYNGWTESPEQTEARRQRILDAQERARQERENADIAEWLGTNVIISGGEVLELGNSGAEDIPF